MATKRAPIWCGDAAVAKAMESKPQEPRFCYISDAVMFGWPYQVPEEVTLFNVQPVRVTKNAMLKAILLARRRWAKMPLIKVHGRYYRLSILEDTPLYTVLIQMCVVPMIQNDGRRIYEPVNKRTVVIMY